MGASGLPASTATAATATGSAAAQELRLLLPRELAARVDAPLPLEPENPPPPDDARELPEYPPLEPPARVWALPPPAPARLPAWPPGLCNWLLSMPCNCERPCSAWPRNCSRDWTAFASEPRLYFCAVALSL